jgi:hypothetical protein
MTAAMLALAATANAATPTVKITKFVASIEGGTKKRVEPGGTITHCASKDVKGVYGKGTVDGATVGDGYKAIWRWNGTKVATFNRKWTKESGKGTLSTIGASDGSMPDGKFKLTVKQDGEALASGAVTLKTNDGC